MKTFIIIGLSTFGKFLAQYLHERGFVVVAIDSDEERIEEVKPYVQKGIIGNAKSKETLEKIGVKDADGVIVSLGEKVDDSLLVIYGLKELQVKNLYVKVITEEHAQIVHLIDDAEIIFPERESAFKLAQRIDNPHILDYIALTEGFSIMDWAPTKSFIGKTLGELDFTNKYNIRVVSIEQTVPESIKMIPRSDFVIKDSDVLVIIGKDEDLERLKKIDK